MAGPTRADEATTSLARIGETIRIGGMAITPIALEEDSRCPQDVDCSWQGQVSLRTRISHGLATEELLLISGQPETVGSVMVTLSEVRPLRTRDNRDSLRSPDAILANYRFGFTVAPSTANSDAP